MADPPKPPRELRLAHVRGPDFRQIGADGLMVRLDGDKVILTFYVNDFLVSSERMELIPEEVAGSTTYKPVGIEEHPQRVQMVSVKMPIAEFFGAADLVRQQVQQVTQAHSTATRQ